MAGALLKLKLNSKRPAGCLLILWPQSSTEHLSSIGIPFFTFNDCNHSTFSVSVFMSLYWTYACTSWLFSKKQPASSRPESRGSVGGAVLGALALVFSDLPPLAFSAVPPALLFSFSTPTVYCIVLSIDLIHGGNEFRNNSAPVRRSGFAWVYMVRPAVTTACNHRSRSGRFVRSR